MNSPYSQLLFVSQLWEHKRGLREFAPTAADCGLSPRMAESLERQVHHEFEREVRAKLQRETEARAMGRAKNV